jgi:amino acid transporter
MTANRSIPSPRPSPVSGLSRRRLSFAAVFAQAVAAVAPAGSMSIIPALVLGVSGPNLFIAYACAMVIIFLISACIRPMAQRMAAVSGLYSYIAKGLGPSAAIVGGWSAVFGYGLIGMAGLLAVGTYLTRPLVSLGMTAATAVPLAVGVMMLAAVVTASTMIRGIGISSHVVLVAECVSIAVLLSLMVVYLAIVGLPSAGTSIRRPENDSLGSLAIGTVVAISAFVGFESSTTLGGEAHKPFVSIPRTIRWTPLAAGAVYLLSISFQETVLRSASTAVLSSPTPLSDLFGSQASPVMAVLVDLCIASSFFAVTLASVNALVRVLFCMGREGVIPKAAGRAHSRFRTPYVAIATVMPVIAAVPISLTLFGVRAEEGLNALLTLGAYGYLGSYLLACAAMPVFLHRIGESRARSWLLASITTGIVAVAGWIAIGSVLQEKPLLPLIFGLAIAASLIHLIALRRRRPDQLATVGVYDEPLRSDRLAVDLVHSVR